MKQHDCIFCQIVAGEAPSHQVWENDTHVAFLSIFPNTPGVTVVIPKDHYDSYAFGIDSEVYQQTCAAAREVGQLIDAAFEDVGRTAMVFEGFGVNHLHAKLFPMHGTGKFSEWQQVSSGISTFFDKYQGYISTHDSKRADDTALAQIAQNIRSQIQSKKGEK